MEVSFSTVKGGGKKKVLLLRNIRYKPIQSTDILQNFKRKLHCSVTSGTTWLISRKKVSYIVTHSFNDWSSISS